MKKLMSMREALTSSAYFGNLLGAESWAPWRALLIGIMGEPLDDTEQAILQELTGRLRGPAEPVDEFWGIIGRRGGKTRAIAVLGAYLAALVDHRHALAPGQWGVLPIMAATTRQAQEAFNYIDGMFSDVPALARRKVGSTADTLSLDSRITIEVRPASFRTVRGFTAVAGIADEIAFWRSDDSANPDKEILAALRPALATTGGPLIAISSPYARRGELFRAFTRHHGPDGDPRVLVAKAPSKTMNPGLRQAVIDRAYQDDHSVAASEYGAEFRTDLEAFISQDIVDAAVVQGRFEQAFVPGARYFGFVDPAGGSGADSMTLGIAHQVNSEGVRTAVLDLCREVRPPFSPDAIAAEFAAVLKSYGLHTVTGDAYGGEWPRERFRTHGIDYKLSDRNRSELYLELLPLLNAGRTQLLDHKRMRAQLVVLERRTSKAGRDAINHPPGGHDDCINAAAGALVLCAGARQPMKIDPSTIELVSRMRRDTNSFASRFPTYGRVR